MVDVNAASVMRLGGITFNDGVPDVDGLKWYLNIVDGADSPEHTVGVEERAGADGVHFAGGYYGRRPLLLEGQVTAPDFYRLKRGRDRLMAATNFIRTLGVLEVDGIAAGFGWRVELYRADRPRFTVEDRRLASFSLPMAAPDPRRYGQSEKNGPVALSAVSTGVTAPVVAPVSAGGGTASQVTAWNDGNVDTPVVLEIRGPVTDPLITHDESGSTIRFSGLVLNAGEVLVIDTHARTIVLGGESRRSYVSGRPGWFLLEPGQNAVRFAAASTDPAASLTVRWRDAYI